MAAAADWSNMPCPGAAEALETDGLIKREFKDGEWTMTRVLAPDDIRVVVWQFNVNEQDRVHGRPLHFPNVTKRWFYFDETTATWEARNHVSAVEFADRCR